LAALLERVKTSEQPLLWLDDLAYSSRLLGYAPTVWLDTAELMVFRRKATELLRPDVAVLPVATVMDAALAAAADLRQAMTAKKRTIVPLRTLLAGEHLRSRLAEMTKAMRDAFRGKPLALTIPSPRKWASDAYRAAFGADASCDVGAEESDAAAVYVAEFLRSFGESGIDTVLLEESSESEPKSAEEVAWYQPVINLAAHYRWELGIHMPIAADFKGELSDVDYFIAPRVLPGVPGGIVTPAEFWDDADAPSIAPGCFRYARIPEGTMPERVLERLTLLRNP
jgi:hypothetical protein